MVTVSALVSGLDAELRRLGYKDSTWPAATSRTPGPHSGTTAEQTRLPSCTTVAKQQLTPCATSFGTVQDMRTFHGHILETGTDPSEPQ